ncbi:Protein Aster-B [Rhizophlyctis rosea]|uniref:Protein Aster-B n=1 Tax=Rhizophlyctis rosea TaxID=64517 RepID=A0AAD5SNN9_9FUNG|nr:Protein Aster-B [Rhizophlyctis rosea]
MNPSSRSREELPALPTAAVTDQPDSPKPLIKTLIKSPSKTLSGATLKEGFVAAASVVKEAVKDVVHKKDPSASSIESPFQSFEKQSSIPIMNVARSESPSPGLMKGFTRRGRSPSKSGGSDKETGKLKKMPSRSSSSTGGRKSHNWDVTPMGTLPLKTGDGTPEPQTDAPAPGLNERTGSVSSLEGADLAVPSVSVNRRPSQSSVRSKRGDGDEVSIDDSLPSLQRGSSKREASVSARDRRKFVRVFTEIEAEVDFLTAAFSCAMERDMLWQGKLYLTSLHMCFYGKIFAKSAKVIIHFKDITAIEKKTTAGMFPTAIRVTTVNAKYVFASFLRREAAYSEMLHLWREVVSPLNTDERAMLGLSSRADFGSLDMMGSISDGNMTDPEEEGVGSSDTSSHSASLSPQAPIQQLASDDVEGWDQSNTETMGDSQVPLQIQSMDRNSRRSISGPAGLDIPLDLPQDSPTSAPLTDTEKRASAIKTSRSATDIASMDAPRRRLRSATLTYGIDFFKRILSTQDGVESPAIEEGQDLDVDSSEEALSSTQPPSAKSTPGGTDAKPAGTPGKHDATQPSQSEMQAPGGGGGDDGTKKPPGRRMTSAASCGCENHYDHTIGEMTIKANVEDVFRVLYGDGDSIPVKEARKKRDCTDIKFGAWSKDNSGRKGREVSWSAGIKLSVLSKQYTPVSQRQVIMAETDSVAYVVENTTRTPKIPFGDCFTNVDRYCLTHAGVGKTKLKVTGKIDWNKKAMWKDRIERESLEGMRLYFQELAPLLCSRFEDPESPRSPKPETPDAPRVVVEDGQAAEEPPASVTETVKTVPALLTRTPVETPESSTRIGKLVISVSRLILPSTTTESGKRQIGKVQSILLVLLAIGLAVALMNTYWVIGLGRRLDRTTARMDRVGGEGMPTAESFAKVAAQMREKSDEHWRKMRSALVDARVKSFALQERLGGLVSEFGAVPYEDGGGGEVRGEDGLSGPAREDKKMRRRELLDSIAALMEKYDKEG